MSGSKPELPAHMIQFADQRYAAASELLSKLIDALVEDMRARPDDSSDAVPWAMVVSQIAGVQREQDYAVSEQAIEVWQAALYKLARQRVNAQR